MNGAARWKGRSMTSSAHTLSCATTTSAPTMPNYSYALLAVETADGVARATIDNPPINLLDLRLMGELDRLETELRADDAVRVVIFDSANPDFSLAHYDSADLISRCGPPPAPAVTLKRFHAMLERYPLMPKLPIALLEGAARGGGSEFALALDMRFAGIDRALLGRPDVALGLIPGARGTQHFARLAGPAPAVGIISCCRASEA